MDPKLKAFSTQPLLNDRSEYIVKSTYILNYLYSKTGILLFGEKGIEFRQDNQTGFLQIPWKKVKVVKVHFALLKVFTKHRKIKAFTFFTIDEKKAMFRIRHGHEVLYTISNHLEREKIEK